jgi:cobalt-zinc-cadmium efflux system membrane fusion protein
MNRMCFVWALGATACPLAQGAPTTPAGESRSHRPTLDAAWDASVKTEQVVAVDLPQGVVTTGRVSFDENRTQRITSPVAGRVVRVLVQVGDTVRAGQPLVDLASPEAAMLQSEVKKAQQDLEIAEKAWQRAEALRADGAVSDREAAQARADYQKALAEAERGEAYVRALGLDARAPLVHAALTSRLGGTVVERPVGVGQEVRGDSAEPLVTLSDLSQVWVVADLYERDLGAVRLHSEARVRVPAYPGEEFVGEVTSIGDVVDAQSRTVKVRCVLANRDRRLKPEMFATVHLNTAAVRAVTVPTRAVVTDGARTKVVIVDEARALWARDVELGPQRDGRHPVLAGLEEGETVVTEGAIFLHNLLRE